MPVFTAAAAAVSTAFAGVTMSSVASFAARTLLTVGVAKLLANRQDTGGSNAPAGAQDNGGRIQLDPSTANKLPVVYGSAFVEGIITDAKISTDNQTMWYVIAFSESISSLAAWDFRSLYWNNNEITLDETDNTLVVSWTNNAEPPQTNTKVNGKINVYFYDGDSNSPVNTPLTAIEVLQDADIPVDQRWTSTDTMDNTVFMIVKMQYDRDAGTTQCGNWKVQLTNNYIKPGTVIYNYMANTVYGCAIPTSQLDSTSFAALNTYSDEMIDFTSNCNIVGAFQTNPCVLQTDVPHGLSNEASITITGVVGMTNLNGNTYYVQTVPGNPNYMALYNDAAKTSPVDATAWPAYVSGGTFTGKQPRYRINGPLATGNNCMNNLELLVDSCDSWLQYSELTGKWKVVINKPYTGAETDLFLIDDSNLVSGIDVNPVDLNSTYNSLEVQYPNFNIRDQYEFPIINLEDYYPNLLSPNEAQNRLTINLPYVNNSIQSTYIGIRRLLQSREDLVVSFAVDYSGIQIEAGDVIRVKFTPYGWDDPVDFPNGKLFRVTQVQEVKDESGNLGVRLTAFEYNGTVYYDSPLDNFVPADNTGLSNPNIIGTPGTPTITDVPVNEGTIASFIVETTVPTTGVVLYMDFNYGTSSTVSTHKLYRTVSKGNGTPYTPGETVTVTVNDLPPGDYYWSITARNNTGGSSSASSTVKVWAGQNITTYTETSKSNVTSAGALLTVPDTTGINIGDSASVTSGPGSIPAGATVVSKPSTTQVLLSTLPTLALLNSAVKFFGGGLKKEQIKDGAVTSDKLGPNVPGYQFKGRYAIFGTAGITLPVNVTSSSTRNVPITIPGTDPGSSYYWPWAQGTSSTADGYAANSTGAYEPIQAALIGGWVDGDYNYYQLLSQSFSANPLSTDEYVLINVNLSVVSDTPNTTFQIALYISTAGPNNTLETQYLSTYNCVQANVQYNFPTFSYTDSDNSILGIGYAIRNITAGSELTVSMCEWTIQQVKT